uniref:Uncharacterized protein n=1 Tax=Ignisphaera aggregans TaxID=334771 RepID=A0A7C5TGR9_9CREN
MHRCISFTSIGFSTHGAEYPWDIALYIEIKIDRVVVEIDVCQHPTYIAIEDLKKFIEEISKLKGSEIDVIRDVAVLLDTLFPDWRKSFEILIRRGSIYITIYI